MWNDLSTQILNIPGPTDLIKQNGLEDILIEFMAFDVKELLARFVYKFQGPEGFRHIEQIKKMQKHDKDATRAKTVLQHCLAGFDVFKIRPFDKDLKYVLVFILLTALQQLDKSTAEYLVNTLESKIAINTTTVSSAREGYEVIRERRKTRIMAAYGDMEKDLRMAIKRTVTHGLTNNDAVVAKSERDREYKQSILDSANDGYDSTNYDD